MDSYQAIYDAVRSRITGGNIGEVVADAARQAFDISMSKEILVQEIACTANEHRHTALEMRRPSVLMRPQIFPEGNQWCVLYGDNLQEGVCAFGDTPEKAMESFDVIWANEKVGQSSSA